MTSTALKQIKTALGLYDHHTYADIFIRVKAVLDDRNQLTKLSADLRTQRDALYERLTQVVDVTGEPTLEELIVELITERGEAIKRTNIHTEYDEGMRAAMQRIAVACGKKFAVDVGYDNLPEVVESLLSERNKAVTTLKLAGYTDNGGELWKPPLGETPERFKPRYIVHGDIQPCVVLYSDETTTLVRLDENDMMCETSTIEWSDELTYRCQELGKAVQVSNRFTLDFAKALASLSRGERVLLNDDGGADNA